MNQVTWILHREILDRLIYHSHSLPDCVESAGHRAIIIDWGFLNEFPKIPNLSGPVVLFGSHPFVKEAYRNIDSSLLQPGGLGINDRTKVSQYMSNLPLDWFLNRDGIFMTWSMFKQRARELFYEHDANKFFIRPDSGFKTFAGQIVHFGTIGDDIHSLETLSSVTDETMILVNIPETLLGEFRFVIADKKVVTGSEYRWDGKLDIRRDWPQECWDLATQVAQHDWQVDIAYTCDVALTENGPKIVELNGFSCAGLYSCDIDQVVMEVSKAATKEYYNL